jgi:hypothetical protein
MPEYMLLLYADEPGGAEEEARENEMPAWLAYRESLIEAGAFRASGRLRPVGTATTLRTRSGDTEVVDGPFATTKELLGGFFLLECADLDEALDHAGRCPLARYGSVEVRPMAEIPVADGTGAASAS